MSALGLALGLPFTVPEGTGGGAPVELETLSGATITTLDLDPIEVQ